MAEEKAAPAEGQAAQGTSSSKPPILLIALVVVNMLVVAAVGFMILKGKEKDAAKPSIEHVIQGTAEEIEAEKHANHEVVQEVVPLETFIVNLSGSKGRRIAKVNMELDLSGREVREEVEKRKAQVRDIIIILLSGKTYDQVSSKEGKEQLREEIKDTVNAFLTKGKIKNVYFTEFIYN